ncbi:MAG: helix-turn-helix domain-containing protein [Actinobacteria bacterium]|nr:helix-turn-helix domain-containing protein [Actinomycetota bacterium]
MRHLSLHEREEIFRGVAGGESLRVIAGRLCRAVWTISREVARNDGRDRYRAHRADRAGWQQARRPQMRKLATNLALRAEGGGGSKPCNPKSPKNAKAGLNVHFAPRPGGGWFVRYTVPPGRRSG